MAKTRHKPKQSKPARAARKPRSFEEVQAIKTALWGAPSVSAPALPRAATRAAVAGAEARRAVSKATGPTLVAEGDSWFDYGPGLDILDHLKMSFGYQIVKLSQSGDTLENMVFGTGLDRNDVRLPVQLNTLVQTVATYQPRAVLFSGGGNDIAGEPFEAFVNHRDSGILPLLRVEYMNQVVGGLFRSAYVTMAKSVWAVSPETHILTHGYGHAIPDGRAVFNFPFGFRFIGPWLKPVFCKKNILDIVTGTEIVAQFIDAFNDMLADVEAQFRTSDEGKFHYIDLRPDIAAPDWVNELHLSDEAYERVAGRFHQVLETL